MSRIERARRKVRVAEAAIGIGAAAGLAVFAGLARSSHPGGHHARAGGTASRSSSATARSSEDTFFGGDDGGSYSNLGPSGSAAPQVQSGGS
jgi:hypothetical protein